MCHLFSVIYLVMQQGPILLYFYAFAYSNTSHVTESGPNKTRLIGIKNSRIKTQKRHEESAQKPLRSQYKYSSLFRMFLYVFKWTTFCDAHSIVCRRTGNEV